LVVRQAEVGASSAGVDVIPARFPKVTVQLINHLDQPFNGEIVYGREKSGGEAREKVELLAHQNATVALSIPNADRTVAAHARASAAPESLFIAVRTVGSSNSLTERRIPI